MISDEHQSFLYKVSQLRFVLEKMNVNRKPSSGRKKFCVVIINRNNHFIIISLAY